ncbi:alkene reductase [Shewanella maritima]|uniref:Alkene reductase n=1 Tax=Shewanella maritima TaxID=2520507 RepID=A0A411PLS4_9GAMM|nr:alkene reductase [Shewanella maritima]QBF84465.1 alkene reductase [Shewanella maritima]
MLFSSFQLGPVTLDNRVAMAPMTRSRTSQPGDVPNDMMATYYAQRANAGLIITEGAPVSDVARGYSMTPGIYTQAHIDGWKKVTDAVHAKGGKIYIQLWHVGRRSHEVIAGETPLSASAVKVPDQVFGPLAEGGFGMIETSLPRAMTKQDIEQTIADFVQAAKNSIEAGFDGVEIHGAHGYLFDQFMRKASNQRTDEYGGSAQNRLRFLIETLDSVGEAIGRDRVAVRLSPHVMEGDGSVDDEIEQLVIELAKHFAVKPLAYLHLSENISNYLPVPDEFRKTLRDEYKGAIMVAGKLTKDSAQQLLASGLIDLCAFGTPYVTNPDLVARFKQGWPLAEFDADARLSLYGGSEQGYIDYPNYSA